MKNRTYGGANARAFPWRFRLLRELGSVKTQLFETCKIELSVKFKSPTVEFSSEHPTRQSALDLVLDVTDLAVCSAIFW